MGVVASFDVRLDDEGRVWVREGFADAVWFADFVLPKECPPHPALAGKSFMARLSYREIAYRAFLEYQAAVAGSVGGKGSE